MKQNLKSNPSQNEHNSFFQNKTLRYVRNSEISLMLNKNYSRIKCILPTKKHLKLGVFCFK